MAILIDVYEDRCGNVYLRPQRSDIRKQLYRHLKEMEPCGATASQSVFIQEGGPAEEFLAELTPQQRRGIRDLPYITIRMDPWEFGVRAGWGFHEVIKA